MTRRQIKRSNLFVLRIWTQEGDDQESDARWQGQVKRAVDGAAHHFDDWQGLVGWLVDNLEGNPTLKNSTGSGHAAKSSSIKGGQDEHLK